MPGTYHAILKRPADVVAATAAFIVLGPLLLVIAIAIRLEDGRPAIFRQTRIGRGGTQFQLLKFRSMAVDSAEVPSARAHALRVTCVGRVIRRLNFDELPQLVNILRGEMSVVGPRPALPSQTELIELRRRGQAAELRPGLTGLAQVNSYDGMPVTEKVEWDERYAGRVSFLVDAAAVGRTVGYLLRPPPRY